MNDLFSKITKGSILLWNVEEEKDLPKRKEIVRLLGTEDFSYYKSHGHHRHYVQSLARLKFCIADDPDESGRGYWYGVPVSDVLFTPIEIEANVMLLLKYSVQCAGSYFVAKSDMDKLSQLLTNYDRVRRIASEIKNWPRNVQEHQAELANCVIQDSVIENFDFAQLLAITKGYGVQAIDHALLELQTWHGAHYWHIKQPMPAAGPKDQALFI